MLRDGETQLHSGWVQLGPGSKKLNMKFLKTLVCLILLAASVSAAEVRSQAQEANKVLLARAGRLHRLDLVNTQGADRFLMLMNYTAVPANGAVTFLYPIIRLAPYENKMILFPRPLTASTGIVIATTTTLDNFTQGASGVMFYAEVE